MRRLPFALLLVLGLLPVAACVGDAEPGAAAGTLDGPCFSNGTCNEGLTCGVVRGVAACIAGGTDAGVGVDAAADAADAADTGPAACTFQPTTFPCPDPGAAACYGNAQSCSLTGCSGLRWACFSPNKCGGGPCCVPKGVATVRPGTECMRGVLALEGAGPDGSVCGPPAEAACPADATQLCQFTSQCPKGMRCAPVGVATATGGPAPSMVGTTLGACIPL